MVVYDRDPAKAAEFSTLGVKVAPNPGTLARNTKVVLSCLSDDAAVDAVYLKPGGVLESVSPGARIIDFSTVAPETSQRLNQAARELGISALDVPISGSTLAAESGSLTLFGGGDPIDFKAAEPIFAAIAKQWFYMGPSGSGVAMKLVVNTILGLGMQAIAESVALGSALGLARDPLFDILAKTAVVAPAHTGKLASAKRSDYTPQFPLRLMGKDFRLILHEAALLGLSMPATEAAASVNWEEASTGSEEDFSAVIRRMEQQAEEDAILPPAA
jgi:3-hydroxyisobutyrate dehydrogenase-like beta-hydroxyacid dehydrogenase